MLSGMLSVGTAGRVSELLGVVFVGAQAYVLDVAGQDFLRPDPDDWFATFALSAPRPPPPPPARHLTSQQVVVAAAIVGVVVLFGSLALAGVFSGSTKPATVAVPTVPPATRIRPFKPPKPSETPRSTVQAPAVILTPGDRGSQVRALQRSLVWLDYSPGAIDGIYGPKTERALETFQARSKLTVDGIFGPKTLTALRKALRRR